MSRSLLTVTAALAVASVMMVAASLAGAAGQGTTVLNFRIGGELETIVGDNLSPSAAQPVGSHEVFIGALYNRGAQFGKPNDAPVGRMLLDCTTLVATPPDGVCTGIVHVPDGFFTITGNGAYTGYKVDHYGISGGDGPYANARGELTNVRYQRGGLVTVTLIQ